ncbi:MAG: YggS family pyridoxal phosphate-dependent enzyme, partial [bacterium]|nr:YggS family pyridoxal phosphate-dependent enzyme [Candidatus Kapabacteria bacterium]
MAEGSALLPFSFYTTLDKAQSLNVASDIDSNFRSVRARVDAACARAGRAPDQVAIVGVTKKHPTEVVSAAAGAGVSDIGENYVQEMVEKNEAIGDTVRWHFIGHLQRNKVRQIASFVHMIHGIDSERLAIEIAEQAREAGRTIPVLLQVNTSGEESKFGVPPDEAVALGSRL